MGGGWGVDHPFPYFPGRRFFKNLQKKTSKVSFGASGIFLWAVLWKVCGRPPPTRPSRTALPHPRSIFCLLPLPPRLTSPSLPHFSFLSEPPLFADLDQFPPPCQTLWEGTRNAASCEQCTVENIPVTACATESLQFLEFYGLRQAEISVVYIPCLCL